MPVLTFRIKLLVAMMLVVVAVSAATLLATQRRVQENYDRLFRRHFERQISYFTSLQDTRLGAVKAQCLTLAGSVRLMAAMDPQDIDPELLYQSAGDELRVVLGSMAEETRLAGPAARGLRASFFRFLDAQGRAIAVPETFKSRVGLAQNRRRLEQRLTVLRGALDHPERQQVGYLALNPLTNAPPASRGKFRAQQRPVAEPTNRPSPASLADTNAPGLQEVIVTKVIDSTSGRTLGALALGFPLPDLIPQAVAMTNSVTGSVRRAEPIQTGILLEDHLYMSAGTMPEDLAAAVAAATSAEIKRTGNNQNDFDWVFEDSQYRVFYELLNANSSFAPAYQLCLYSLDEAKQEQTSLRWRILGVAGVAVVLAFGLSLALAHGLSVPIRELVAGTNAIQQGNFAIEVPVRGRDELGRLASSFNDMAKGLAQKERYRTVLNMVADESVAQRLVSGEITLGGELREVSVLFCDIRKFTELTQNMPPTEVIEMLNEHMTALTRVVKEHGGVLDKFVGDLLMALFGAPISRGEDALDAARCALGLQAERQRLNAVSRHQLSIGVGFVSGPVVAGCMGSADQMRYTVLGERVNLASRLCDQATPGEILTDESTATRLGDRAAVEPGSVLQLKGFAEPVKTFRLLEVRSDSDSL